MESDGSQEDAQGWSFSLFAFYLAASHLTAEPVASAPSGTVVRRSPIRPAEEVVAESLLPCGRSRRAAQALVSVRSLQLLARVCAREPKHSHTFFSLRFPETREEMLPPSAGADPRTTASRGRSGLHLLCPVPALSCGWGALPLRRVCPLSCPVRALAKPCAVSSVHLAVPADKGTSPPGLVCHL